MPWRNILFHARSREGHHHLLDEENLKWLSLLKNFELSEADMRALVFAKEVGAITNQDYRQINGTLTSAASSSKALGRLRDLSLLTMKGAGNGTYYTLGPKINEAGDIKSPNANLTPHISALSGELTPHISTLLGELTPNTNPLYKGLAAIPAGFPPLSDELTQQIVSLRRRCKSKEIKDLLKKLCSVAPLQLAQLAQILSRDPRYLRDYFLSKMVKSGELIYRYPDQPAHPQQAYKTPIEKR